MTADRLREAADRLGRDAQFDEANGHDESAAFCRKTAALLRAVADDIDDWRRRLEGAGPDPAPYGIPTRGWDAALALADTILGAES